MATDLMSELVTAAGRLPADKLREVVEYVRAIEPAATTPPEFPQPDPRFGALQPGCLADPRYSLGLEDFQQLRREMWANFPREFPPAGGEV